MIAVTYHESAKEELLAQIGYYENRRKGLGRRFHEEVQRAEKLARDFPQAAPEIRP